ncbi:MAG: hypothetical protein AB4911_19340 [Oscillochloridaceae bacterium umkhey_bin13]
MNEHSPPPALQLVHVPGLSVTLVAISAAEAMYHPEAMPVPLPLADSPTHPLPAYLPADLRPMRLGEGYCAIDPAGQFQVTWIELLVPANATLSLPWDLSEGPAPAMQGFQFRGRAAVALTASWSMVTTARLPLVVTRAGPDTCWLVGGTMAIDELARIAVSLPG